MITSVFFSDGLSWISVPYIALFVLIEMPIIVIMLLGFLKYLVVSKPRQAKAVYHYPTISCLVMGYNEGKKIIDTVRSLAYQRYAGSVEIIVVIDGASKNTNTLEAAMGMKKEIARLVNRRLIVIPKWKRSGVTASENCSLAVARGDIIIDIDGDSSYDDYMVSEMVKCFQDENVVAVSGNIRARNANTNVLTRLQAIEYALTVSLCRTGLSQWNLIEIISGAFGAYRPAFLKMIGGWKSGTGQDLDITRRIRNYFGRYPHLKIVFAPRSICYSDVPESYGIFMKQRLRWDIDYIFIALRRHWVSLTPRICGWKSFLMTCLYSMPSQISFSLVIFISTIVLLHELGFYGILIIFKILYMIYLPFLFLLFMLYLWFVSDQKREDAKLLPLLFVFPVFKFAMRLFTLVALLKESVCSEHRQSSLAPWWVLRRSG